MEYTPNKQLYKWSLTDTKRATIIEMAKNADKIDEALNTLSSNLADIVKRVEEFRINGESDETQQLQRAFNFVKDQVLLGNRVELQFKSGKIYNISAPLDFTYHQACTITGSATIRVANSVTSIPYMVDMRETASNLYRVARFTIRDITFDANGKADKIIEAWGDNGRGLYYTTLNRCFFYGIKENGFGIHGVSWQTTIEDCFFMGSGYNTNTPTGYAIRLGNMSNEVVIERNEFNTLQNGIMRDTGSYGKTIIKHNVFEQIKYAGVKLEGSENVTIDDNYFENVGGTADTIYVLTNTSVSVDGCIVVVGSRTNWDLHPVNCSIKNNEFADCPAQNLIVFDRGYGLEIKGNVISNKTSPHNSLLKLLKYGFGYYNRQNSYGAIIENNKVVDFSTANPNGLLLVNKILDIDNLSPSNTVDFFTGVTLSKVVIKDVAAIDPTNRKKKVPSSLYNRNFITDASYTDFFTITKEVISGENVYNFLRTSNATKLDFIDIHASFLERLKGTYVRFNFEVANSQNGAGVRFEVTDGLKTLLYLPNENQLDKTNINNYVPMSFIYYVDPSATKLGFRINSYCSTGQSIFIKNFSVVPSVYDLEQYTEMI